MSLSAVVGVCAPPTTSDFDVLLTASAAGRFCLSSPNGKRLVVVGEDVTVSEIPGVQATVTSVDDVGDDSPGPAGIEVDMTKPLSGLWKIEMTARRRTGVTLVVTAETDSICQSGDALLLDANGVQAWRLDIGSGTEKGKCPVNLKRVPKVGKT